MRRYVGYLYYVLIHKWYVFVECCRLGIPVQGIFHDWSKLLPSELIPYAYFFNNKDGSKRIIRDKTGYYKATDTGNKDFDRAWFFHQSRNKHHWQYWIVPDVKVDSSGNITEKELVAVEIPRKYTLEMVADWRGAGKAQGTPNTLAWYRVNKNKMVLHERTREHIEELIGYREED